MKLTLNELKKLTKDDLIAEVNELYRQRDEAANLSNKEYIDACDGLACAADSIERAYFIACNAVEAHGCYMNREAINWLETIIDIAEQCKVNLKESYNYKFKEDKDED